MALIAFKEAIARALQGVTRLATERVGLARAHNRVLAEDLVAAVSLPAFDYSAMDGYAVHSSTFEGDGPWTMPVHGESRAGAAGPTLPPASACRIFTGAPIPAGADAVIIQENVTRSDDRITTVARPCEGQHIRLAGADLKAGAQALSAGMRLTPGRLGLVAALDRTQLLVARRPVVAIVSTGDELRSPGALGDEGSVVESNSIVIAAMARRVGAIARVMPLVADNPKHTQQQIRRALRGTDLLVTVGGASMGDHDLVRPAMNAIGVHIDFWGVAIKPGKPTAVGSYGDTKVLCLPGNPASAGVTFMLFGLPLLRAMQGEDRVRPRRIPMRIVGSHGRKPGRQEYLRAQLRLRDGQLCAVLPTGQSSGAVTSIASADALVVVDADRAGVDDGDRLPVIPFCEI